MKKIFAVGLLLILAIGICLSFAGCDTISTDDLDNLIEYAVSDEVINNTDYTLKAYGTSVTNNDKIYYELNYKSEGRQQAKFTIVDERDFKYTQYITSYYGASVPQGKYSDFWQSFPNSLFNLEKAAEEDYQDWYFYPATLYYDKNSQDTKKYYTTKQNEAQSQASVTVKRQFENGWQDFMSQADVAKCDIKYLANAINGIKDYIDFTKCSVETKGRISTFTFSVKEDCDVEYQGEKLANQKVEISFTNKKISYFNLEGKFKIYVAYGGSKILMPNYDDKSFVDFNTQIIA